MWPIYLMRSGEEKPENVSKNDLTQIIALLLRKLGWLEKSIITSNEDSETTNAAIKEDHKRNNVTTSDTWEQNLLRSIGTWEQKSASDQLID